MDKFSNEFNNSADNIFNQFFDNSNVDNAKYRYLVNGKEVTTEQFAEMQKTGDFSDQPNHEENKSTSNINMLEKLGRNLTNEAKENKLDPVIGRDKEIQETAEVLARRIKNNPVLIGNAGVGKTAVVEGLAQSIINENVPEAIENKEIISIDISALEAGTQYRGSFEQNIQELLKEVKDKGNIILFFDEIHQILGAGGSGGDSGSKGLSDIIKPALSRGEISLIGATTQNEYRNTIMKDTALARRFNEVQVKEPSNKTTFEILKRISPLYEKHHHIELPDDVLKASIDFSNQYIPQRYLPDKAIDLMDITAAHLASKRKKNDKHQIEVKIEKESEAKQDAVNAEDYEEALAHQNKIESLKQKLDNSNNIKETIATTDDVADSIERITAIPVSKMDNKDIKRLKDMDSRLLGKVIGQDKAIRDVSRAIRRNRAGFDEGNRPIGSFLFVGPTGVGKTELAKQLALDMFGKKDAIIRLDMSEYSDGTAVSKLIGASAGYVGYNDINNTLTEKVRQNPYSIILLDEIEKANSQVLTLLLQVLDDGRLSDAQGNTVNFKNTIVIATSNAGFENVNLDDNDSDDIIQKLTPYFRPEFLNRFNSIIKFAHLTKTDLKKIVNLMLDDVQKTLAKKDMDFYVTDETKEYLIKLGYNRAMGARPLRRVIEQQIRDNITDFYLDNIDVKHLLVTVKDDTINISENQNYQSTNNKFNAEVTN